MKEILVFGDIAPFFVDGIEEGVMAMREGGFEIVIGVVFAAGFLMRVHLNCSIFNL